MSRTDRSDEPGSAPYGIVVSKDVMVEMRDGIQLATDVYRPGRDGELVAGRFPTIVCLTPYDKTERRYTEIADFFVPHGYAVVLQDLRDRHRSEGTKEYFHSATPHTGEDGYDTIEWIAAQPWSNGRTGMVGSSYACDHAGPHRARAAAAPHRDLARRRRRRTRTSTRRARAARCSCTCSGRSTSTPPTPRTCGRPGASRRTSGTTYATCASSSGAGRGTRASARSRTCRRSTRRSRTTRPAAPTTTGGRRRRTTSRASSTSTPTFPATMTTGWYDGFPHADTEYFAAMAEKNATPQRLIVGPWSHVGMRGDATLDARRRLRRDSSVGRAALLRGAARVLRPLPPGRATGQPPDEAPVRIFVMGGGSGRKTDARQARPRRPLARRAGVAARARRADDLPPARRRLALARGAGERRAAALHLRPRGSGADDRRQLLRRRRAAGGRARGWSRCGRVCSTRCSGCATS